MTQWLEIMLTDPVKVHNNGRNKRAIGAKIRVKTSDGREQMREIHAGSSHSSTHSFIQHFGIPAGTTVDTVEVEWPRFAGGLLSVGRELVDTLLGNGLSLNSKIVIERNGLLTGRVTWGGGQPLPSVTILAVPSSPPFGGISATTDSNGWYVIDGVRHTTYAVFVINVPPGFKRPPDYIINQGIKLTNKLIDQDVAVVNWNINQQ
jgi:hypothetical protein